MIDLNDHVAMVTGGGRGIGRATAEALAKSGADVVIADIDDVRTETATAIEQEHGQALAVEMDVTDRDEVERAVEQADETFGTVDILVNNAGIFPTAALDELSPEEWRHVIDVNLTGAFNCVQAVLPGMREQSHGRIVNIGSVSGGQIGWAGNLSHYAASKGGMVGFTRSAAIALAPDGITINAILPGMIDTGAAEQVSSDDDVRAAISMTPVGRMGEPGEIGFLVAALSAPEAGFVTGTTLVADGGITLV